jgi:thiamine pyrophosphate-dependent acetolactate synthase large subunit-like protein
MLIKKVLCRAQVKATAGRDTRTLMPHHIVHDVRRITPEDGIVCLDNGIKRGRVESGDAVAPALEKAFASGGLHLITISIDYSENSRVFIDELPDCASGQGEQS